MNRKGVMFDVIIWIIVVFVMMIFFVGWKYGFGLLTASVSSLPILDNGVNAGQIGADTFGRINTGLETLKWLSLVIAIAMIISIMVSNFLVKAHPVFWIVYVLMSVVGVMLAVYVSNAYESILTSSNPLTASLQSFTAMHYILMHLPIWVTIISFMGGIFLFIGVIVDRDQGGSIPI